MNQTSKGKSTPQNLKEFQETTFEEIISNSTSDELSLKDIVPTDYFNKIYNLSSSKWDKVYRKMYKKIMIRDYNNLMPKNVIKRYLDQK